MSHGCVVAFICVYKSRVSITDEGIVCLGAQLYVNAKGVCPYTAVFWEHLNVGNLKSRYFELSPIGSHVLGSSIEQRQTYEEVAG